MRERDKLINREKQRQDVLSRRAGRPPDSPKADDQHDLPGILEEEEGGGERDEARTKGGAKCLVPSRRGRGIVSAH